MSLLPFDQKEGVLWINGKFVVWKEATIHPLSHGLHYASSVIEGTRIYNGKPFLLAEHIERLYQSASILDLKIPYLRSAIIEATHSLLDKDPIEVGYIRHLAWRSSEQLRVTHLKHQPVLVLLHGRFQQNCLPQIHVNH